MLPETLYLMSQRFNLMSLDCYTTEAFCLECAVHGLSVMHGTAGRFRRHEFITSEEPKYHFISRMFSEVSKFQRDLDLRRYEIRVW